MAQATDLADTIVCRLNKGTWSTQFTAQRALVFEENETQSANIYVIVVPYEVETSASTRAGVQRRFTIRLYIQLSDHVALQMQDELVQLGEDIEDMLYTESQMDRFSFIGFDDRGGRTIIDARELAREGGSIVSVISAIYTT